MPRIQTSTSHLSKSAAALLVLAPFASADLSLTKNEVQLGHLNPVSLNDDDEFGTSLSRIGDFDGDGVEDVVVGIPGDDAAGFNTGAIQLIRLDADMQPIGVSVIYGDANTPRFGTSVANLGDVNGDDINDLAVGFVGGVEILFLDEFAQVSSSTTIADGVNGFSGASGDHLGCSVAALGDFTGDGIRDVAVGAQRDSDGGFWRGAVYLIGLDTDGTVKSQRKISSTQGAFSGALDDTDYFGSAIARVGDIDFDGITDIAVGAEGDDDGGSFAGAVWVLRLNADGTVKASTKVSGNTGGFTGDLDDGDAFGCSLARMGDLNGDGFEDLAVGAYGDDATGFTTGAVWMLFLLPDGTVTDGFKYREGKGISSEIDDGDLLGAAVANIGDLDGDGVDEIAIGAIGNDDSGPDRGAVYLLSPIVQVAGQFAPAGCNLNPAGSLTFAGAPALGETLEFAIDNPLGTQVAGALPVLVASLNNATAPCGLPLAGWNMDPAQANGELVALPPYLTTLYGANWAGPGTPSVVELSIPSEIAFIGLEIYVQGALYNLFPAPGTVATGLTRAVRMTIGSCP